MTEHNLRNRICNRLTLDEFKLSNEHLPRYKSYRQRFREDNYGQHDFQKDFDPIRILFSHEDLLPPFVKVSAFSDEPEISLEVDSIADGIFFNPDCNVPAKVAAVTEVNINDDLFSTQPARNEVQPRGESIGRGNSGILHRLESGLFFSNTGTATSNNALKQEFLEMTDQTAFQVIDNVCLLRPTEQDKFIKLIASALLKPKLNGCDERPISRWLESALKRYVTTFPSIASSELLPWLVISAPRQAHLADVVRQSVGLLESAADKNTLMWLAMKEINSLHRAHLPLLLPLLHSSSYQREPAKLMELMLDSATRFRRDSDFGRLLLAAATALPEQHDAVRNMCHVHVTGMAARALAMLPPAQKNTRARPTDGSVVGADFWDDSMSQPEDSASSIEVD